MHVGIELHALRKELKELREMVSCGGRGDRRGGGGDGNCCSSSGNNIFCLYVPKEIPISSVNY